MPELLLLRHAKSSWDDPALDDFDRPLGPRGRRAAPVMGRHLRERGLVPDRVLCSAAARARETWARAAPELGTEPPVTYLRTLYLASPARLLSVLARVAPGTGRVLLVGHNPGLEGLAQRLARSGDAESLDRLSEKFPTAALARITFAGPWADLARSGGTLVGFVRPKDLSSGAR